MAQEDELKRIKKLYGENFMKLCRRLFPTLLEKEGLLSEVLNLSFATNSRTLYEDIVNNGLEDKFKNYIYSKVDVEDPDKKIIKEESPYELLDEAGYDLYECTTEEEIQKFKKYYASGEELCTFHGGRLESCVVFFAVKKDVDRIKRENFKTPNREDEYGTSVMGIQFTKGSISTVSIKNRYNHTVNNPDATYGNDLDRIIPGLTQSFAKLLDERGLSLNNANREKIQIPGWSVANNGKYYKYNKELLGTYFCPGNILLHYGELEKLSDPEKKILIDYYVLDLENKTFESYFPNRINDSFPNQFENIEKIEIRKNKEKGIREIKLKKADQESPIILEIDNDNKLVGYENKELKECPEFFLMYNTSLKSLRIPNVEKIGQWIMPENRALQEIDAPKVPELEERFDSIIRMNNKENNINSKDIAKLDKKAEITTSEVNFARRIFNRIRNVFRREDRNNNGR